MKPGNFMIGTLHSEELGMRIQTRPRLVTPRRKTSPVSIPGKSGIVFFDEEAYENTPLELNIYMKASDFEEAEYKRNRLFRELDTGGYVPFVHYADSNKVYYVHLEDMDFSGTRILKGGHIIQVLLSVKPFKLQYRQQEIEITQPRTIRNPYLWGSVPIITVHGTGDGSVVVNGEPFVFKNVTGTLVIDSTVEHSYRYLNGNRINENKKVFTIDYPTFKSGDNTLSFSGGVTKLVIEPRWQTLI